MIIIAIFFSNHLQLPLFNPFHHHQHQNTENACICQRHYFTKTLHHFSHSFSHEAGSLATQCRWCLLHADAATEFYTSPHQMNHFKHPSSLKTRKPLFLIGWILISTNLNTVIQKTVLCKISSVRSKS